MFARDQPQDLAPGLEKGLRVIQGSRSTWDLHGLQVSRVGGMGFRVPYIIRDLQGVLSRDPYWIWGPELGGF